MKIALIILIVLVAAVVLINVLRRKAKGGEPNVKVPLKGGKSSGGSGGEPQQLGNL